MKVIELSGSICNQLVSWELSVTVCSVTVYKSKYKKDRGRRSRTEREKQGKAISAILWKDLY